MIEKQTHNQTNESGARDLKPTIPLVSIPLVIVAIIDPGEAFLMCTTLSVEIAIQQSGRSGPGMLDGEVMTVEFLLAAEGISVLGTRYADLLSAIFGEKASVQAPVDRSMVGGYSVFGIRIGWED